LHRRLVQEFSPANAGGQDWKVLEKNHDGGVPWETLPWEEDCSSRYVWDYQKHLVLEEFPLPRDGDLISWVTSLLNRLVELESDYAKQVHDCKSRDDVRGHQTIPGYASSHVAAGKDPVVVQVRAEAAASVDKARRLIRQIRPLTMNRGSKL
jgi:hypothetical protein